MSHLIAVVDDNDAMREALADLLRSWGYRTEQFSSAEAYMTNANPSRINCIVLDIKMPGMSGLDLLKVLRDGGRHPPVVFMTSYSDERTRASAIDGGAHGFFTKPLDSESFHACLKTAVG